MSIKRANLFFITLIILSMCSQLQALIIPIFIGTLGKPIDVTRFLKKEQKISSCSTYAGDILASHRSFNGACAILVLDAGVGTIALIPSLLDQCVHVTPWGKEYAWARKIKNLLNATSDSKKNNDELVSFYLKLLDDYARHSVLMPPSFDDVRELLKRANNTGLLCERNLINEIMKADSLSPLRWLILNNELEDRVQQMEAILAEREWKEEKIKEKLKQMNDDVFEVREENNEPFTISCALRSEYSVWFEQLYADLSKKIFNIKNFSFQQ